MNDTKLFCAADGTWYSVGQVKDALVAVGASDCSLLFVQTDIMFGIPNRELKRKEYLNILSEILLSLQVKTLVLPTFTYSFANHEIYDVRNSKTSMGVLLEHMRKMPQAIYRTPDPLLSVTVLGEGQEHFQDLGHDSLGPNSAFDRIHQHPNAKFLMFGGEFGESFTYVHHVEKMLNVPYRYDQSFHGTILDDTGKEYQDTYSIHTACGGVLPRSFYDLEEELVTKGLMKRQPLGDGKLVCVGEADVYREIVSKIQGNINYFLERPFTADDLTHEYKYGKNGERVTHC